jgi:hypothetical protein
MIRIIVALLATAASAAAQVPSLSFDSGKSLPIATGQWSYVTTTTGSEARYGAHIAIRCDRATRTVSITRMNLPNASLTISTSELTRALPVGGRLFANDPLLDAIAFSRGRFLVSSGSEPVLAIPNWPEAARSIEDCRN